MDEDFGNGLCDSDLVCDTESEASWDSEVEVSETDFGLESEGPRSEPIKSGSQPKTAVESTTYTKSSSQPVKPVGNVITHADSVPTGLPRSPDDAAHSAARGSSLSSGDLPPPIDDLSMELITDKIHEMEKCHCVRPKHPDKRVRFEEYVEPPGGLHILTPMRRSPISVVSEPEWHEIEITVDSGACDTVMPTKLCPHISLMATAKS